MYQMKFHHSWFPCDRYHAARLLKADMPPLVIPAGTIERLIAFHKVCVLNACGSVLIFNTSFSKLCWELHVRLTVSMIVSINVMLRRSFFSRSLNDVIDTCLFNILFRVSARESLSVRSHAPRSIVSSGRCTPVDGMLLVDLCMHVGT